METAKRASGVVSCTAGAVLCLLPVPAAPALASDTPDPASVTIAGSLQSELGCAGDWDPACTATQLAYDADDTVWQQTFSLPAGSYEYKAALNGGWTENYGAHALRDGPNIPLDLAADGSVKFYYSHATLGREQPRCRDRDGAEGATSRSSAARATGILPACARGCRTRTATASLPSSPPRSPRAAAGEGGDRRELGRELRRRRGAERGQHPVRGPERLLADAVPLRRGDARAGDRGRAGGGPAAGQRDWPRQLPGRGRLRGRLGSGVRRDAPGVRRRGRRCGRTASRSPRGAGNTRPR